MPAWFERMFTQGPGGARSTVLHSLQWALGMVLGCIPASVYAGADTWVVVSLVSVLFLFVLSFLVSYFVFVARGDSDSLRSESFVLGKMAIERGSVGDSMKGEFAASEDVQGHLVDASKDSADD